MSIYVYPSNTESEVKNIYIGEYVPNFATQGPCPDGYHIPTQSDASGLCTIINSLGLSGTEYMTCLFMPLSGYRAYNYSGQVRQRNATYLFTCTSKNNSEAYYFAFYDGGASYYSMEKSNGASIRPFKNNYVNPDSTWTVIKGTLGSAGIFWNQNDGIISITSDGSTGYTITDKNLGATTVYNSGDTSSESNCGKYYERGNNYGFDGIGGSNPSTSSSTVNASTYGPGNYYSNSTFRTTNPWDSSNNQNLRGGVTGNVPVD